VRPLLDLHWSLAELAAFFIAWLIVAQALVHLTRRQRAVDALLIVVATVLVGRALVAGVISTSEIVAIALVVPALVPLSRVEDRTRCLWLALMLIAWLGWLAIAPLVTGHLPFECLETLEATIRRAPPAPAQLFGKAFCTLRSAGCSSALECCRTSRPARAAGRAGTLRAAAPARRRRLTAGRTSLAALAGVMVARWMPSSQPRTRTR
jgi:hypothetical protein